MAPPALPLPPCQVYRFREVAALLGLSTACLGRPGRLERLYAQGMPRPISTGPGGRRFPKAAFDAWIEGRPTIAPPEGVVDDWRAYLAEAYGSD